MRVILHHQSNVITSVYAQSTKQLSNLIGVLIKILISRYLATAGHDDGWPEGCLFSSY
jgi:hypothetical protein